jgi:putative protease
VLAVATRGSGDGVLPEFYQKNKFTVGDSLELLTPGKVGQCFTAERLFDTDGQPIESTPHPEMRFTLDVPFPVREGDILRFAKR